MPYIQQGIFHDALSIFLFLRKRSACRLLKVIGAAAFNVHVISVTFVISVVDTLHGLAVDTDGLAGMNYGALEGINSLPLGMEALATGSVTVIGMLSSHHDIAFTAQAPVVVGTILHCTF